MLNAVNFIPKYDMLFMMFCQVCKQREGALCYCSYPFQTQAITYTDGMKRQSVCFIISFPSILFHFFLLLLYIFLFIFLSFLLLLSFSSFVFTPSSSPFVSLLPYSSGLSSFIHSLPHGPSSFIFYFPHFSLFSSPSFTFSILFIFLS
jgi:hypothetical protein